MRYLAPLAWAALIWRLTTPPQPTVFDNSLLQYLLTATSHFVFFGIQATLLCLARFPPRNALLITSLYGAVIEGFQLDIAGRSADPVDWVLDTLGALAFLYLLKRVKSAL